MVKVPVNHVPMKAPLGLCDWRRERVWRPGIAVLSVLMACMIGSCTAIPGQPTRPLQSEFPNPSDIELDARSAETVVRESPEPSPSPFSLEDRMAFGTLSGPLLTDDEPARVFSFRAREMPLVDALRLFSRANTLNIVVEPGVEGVVTVDFQGLAIEKAMAALLDTQGYYWERDGELLVVRRLKTRIFTLDYICLLYTSDAADE